MSKVLLACLERGHSVLGTPVPRWWMQVEDLGLSASPHWCPVQRFDPVRRMLVVLASDGVWDVASAERVMQVRPTCSAGCLVPVMPQQGGSYV